MYRAEVTVYVAYFFIYMSDVVVGLLLFRELNNARVCVYSAYSMLEWKRLGCLFVVFLSQVYSDPWFDWDKDMIW